MGLAEKMQRVEQLQQLISAQEQQIQQLMAARTPSKDEFGQPYSKANLGARGAHAVAPSVYSNIETPTPGVPQWGAMMGLRMPTEPRDPALQEEMLARHRDWQKNVAAVIEPGTDAGLIERLGAEVMMLGSALPEAAFEASRGPKEALGVARGFAQFPLEAVSKASALSEGMAENNPFIMMLKNLAPDQMEKFFEAARNLRGKAFEVFNSGLSVLGLEIKHRTPGEAIEDIKRQPLTSAAEAGMALGGIRSLGKLGKYVKPKAPEAAPKAEASKPAAQEIPKKQASIERALAKWKEDMENPPGAARSKVEKAAKPKAREVAPALTDKAFAREYRTFEQTISRAEKNRYKSMTPEQRKSWDSGRNWEEFSRKQGYSEAEIADFKHWLELNKDPRVEAVRTGRLHPEIEAEVPKTKRTDISVVDDIAKGDKVQPWKMRKADYYKSNWSRTRGGRHSVHVKRAYADNRVIPAEVLAEYPELVKPQVKKIPPSVVDGIAVGDKVPPWKMTKAEYLESNWYRKRGGSHIMHLRRALGTKKPVPAEVLAEYPQFAKAKERKHGLQRQKAAQRQVDQKAPAKAQEVAPKPSVADRVTPSMRGQATRAKNLVRPLREELVHLESVFKSGELETSPIQMRILRTRIAKLKAKIQGHEDKISAVKPVMMEAGPSFIGRAIKRTAGDILDIGKKILISGEGRGKSKPYKDLVESMRRVNDTHGPVRDAFIEKLREGGVWKLRHNPKKSVELGEYLIQGHGPPKGHPLHEAGLGYYRAVQAAFRALRKQGVQVRARGTYGRTGKMRPIGEVPNYFPRRLQAKIKESLFEEAATLVERAMSQGPHEFYESLGQITPKTEPGIMATLNRLMKDYTPQYADFATVLKYRISTGLSKTRGKAVLDIYHLTGPDIYRRGALEHGRTLDFPIPMYDTDVVRVMSGYADELGRVVGEVKEWGPFRQKIVHQLADIAAESPKEGQTAIQMVKQFMGTAERLTGAKKRLAETYVNLAVTRKIGLGLATIPNMFQTGISIVFLGYKPTMLGLVGKKGLRTPVGRKLARLSSSPYGDFIRNYYGTDVSNVSLSRQAAKFTTTVNGFQMVNRFNKALGALTMRYKLPQLHKWANLPVRKIAGKGKPGEWFSRRAYGRSLLKKLGVDHTKPLTEDVIIRASHRFATESQLMKTVYNEPLLMTNPRWKHLFLFKSFIWKQLKFTKDYVLKEAHRNPMPLVRLIASGIGAGELIVQAKELVRETLTGEERKRKAQSLVERAMFDLAASATFGIATEVFDAFDPYETPSGSKRGTIANVLDKFKFLIEPILFDELYKVGKISYDFSVDVVDKGFTPKEAALRQGKSAAYIMGSIPGGLFKGQMSKKVRETSIHKLLRDARKATSKEIRRNKEAAAKGLQTRWNKQHPKDRISILR